MPQSRSVFSVDLYMALSTVTLVVIGILFIFSSGVTATGQIVSREYLRQIAWAGSGLVIMLTITVIDYRVFLRPAIVVYIGVIALLGFTLIFGRVVNGARSWIGIGPLGVQPSEFAKVALILMLARFYAADESRAHTLRGFLIALAITLLPTGLVLLQPDLGSSLVYLPIFIVVAFAAGVPWRYVGFFAATTVLTGLFTVLPVWSDVLADRTPVFVSMISDSTALPLLIAGLVIAGILAAIGYVFTHRRLFWWLAWMHGIVILSVPFAAAARAVLQDYQIMRLIVFLDPYVDPRGAGWNIIQSMTAVGSGGLLGKGYLQGTQSHYQFLPQQSTDFIFSILAEEWGFIGVMIVFALFATILGRGIYIMASSRDRFAALLAAGVVGLFLFHFVVNVGMAVGIMPITGIPLYLVSYGGSSLWSAMAAIGLTMSVYQHRYQY